MKRPPTKQKSFKSYLEALNSSLKNAVAACRAEDTGPGMVTLGQIGEGLRFHVVELWLFGKWEVWPREGQSPLGALVLLIQTSPLPTLF